MASWYHKKGAKGKLYLGIINCFGAGVFFGTAVMHMIPEVKEMMQELLLDEYNINFPLAEAFLGFGFFLLLFIERIVSLITHRRSKLVRRSASGPNFSKSHSDGLPNKGCVNGAFPALEKAEVGEGVPETKGSSASFDLSMVSSSSIQELSEEDLELRARPFVFLVALSVDCIFEGMSLSLQRTSFGVWMLVVAILSHELVITFSFGLRLLKIFSTKKMFIIIFFYSITIPVGIVIGFVISELGSNSDHIDIVGSVFLAIAAGIFIYITFLEILNEELSNDKGIAKPIAMLLGFIFMALMVVVEEIETEDEGSSSSSQEMFAMNETMGTTAM